MLFMLNINCIKNLLEKAILVIKTMNHHFSLFNNFFKRPLAVYYCQNVTVQRNVHINKIFG